jgi:hypothetical protein
MRTTWYCERCERPLDPCEVRVGDFADSGIRAYHAECLGHLRGSTEERAAQRQPAPAEGDSDDNERFIANIDDKGAVVTAPTDRPADGDGARGGAE